MARIARRIAGIGASDLPDAAAFDAYVGPAREITVDYQRAIIALHDGFTPGGQQFHAGGGGGEGETAIDPIPKSFAGKVGDNQTYTLDLVPATAGNILVYVGGIRQVPDVDYTISGATLTILSNPEGLEVDTLLLAGPYSLTFIQNGSVTEDKLSLEVIEKLNDNQLGDGEVTEVKLAPEVIVKLNAVEDFSEQFNEIISKQYTVNTFAEADALVLDVAPESIRTAGYYAVGDAGAAVYKKVASEPSHAGKFSITLTAGGTVWYELSKHQTIYVEMFGAVAHQTDAAALAGGAADSTTAILNAIAFMRSNPDLLNDGLTSKTITVYSSGTIHFGLGIFNVTAGAIRITQDLNLVWQGKGCRGKNNFARAATTVLVTGATANTWAAYGIEAYGNGSRGFRQLDMDICYATSAFQGNVLSLKGSPGSYPERCMIGTFGIRGGNRLQTARSCISLAWDEFFNPNECVFDGAQYFIKIEDDNRLASFTGSVSGTTLTVSAISYGELGVDVRLYDAGVYFATITALGTGTGGVGTYTISPSATKSSRDMEGDNSWGGSNSNIDNCVFYDASVKSIEYRGARRRTRQGVRNTIVNPININAALGIDLRNVDGVAIDNCDFVGSVGNAPTNGWLWLQNCTGIAHGNVFGEAALGATLQGIIDFTGNTLNGIGGVVVNGGIITGKSNEFILTSGSGWTIPIGTAAFIDLGPEYFGSNVSVSYNIQGSAGTNNAKGRIYRSASNDFSTSGAANGASAVTITSV